MLQQQFAAGKLGMYIGAPDDIYNVIVPTDKGNLSDIGMGALPSLTGTPAGSLSGGNSFMFSPKDTPAQIAAGVKWLNFEDLTPGVGQFNFQRQKADGFTVGFPEPQLFDGASGTKVNQLRTQYATIPVSQYTSYSTRRRRATESRPMPRPSTRRLPGHARRADRAERRHPGPAQDRLCQRQHDPGEFGGVGQEAEFVRTTPY